MAEQPDALTGALDFLHGLDESEDRFDTLARQMTNNLFVLIRSAGMHDLENDAMNRPYDALVATVNELVQTYNEEVSLQIVDGNFFVNKRLVKLDFSSFQNARYLRRIFKYLEINQFLVTQEIRKDDLRGFLVAFLKVVRDGDGPIANFALNALRLRNISQTEAYEELRSEDDPRAHILSVYASGLLMLRQFTNDLRKGRAPRHAKVKRLCLELIDAPPSKHNLLLALVHLEAYKGNLFCHMLNTAVLAIVFGTRLGLPRRQLLDMGMAAFHHDLGWALLGTLERGGEGDDEALTMQGINYIRDHSPAEMEELRIKVARSLVRMGGFNELIINRLIVAYECQIPEDAPAVGLYYAEIGASLMTHVVRMASTYDEMTTPREDRPALLPDQAMKRILDDGGRTYDEFLAKLFANCMGIYPVGTLVELDTTEVGLVVNLPKDPVNFHRPQVKLLVDRMGRPLADGDVVDLSDTYRGGGRYVRAVERALDSRRYGVSITKFFFG
jgi:HD-GYP domain-containing protein (c-di-GMP phosphodiesterase class II)